MATPAHTPSGRGYDTFLGYFQHANGYWDKQGHIESTGNVDLCLNRFTDLFMENETYRGGVLDSGYLDSSCSSSDDEDPECYEEHIFKSRTLEILDEHDPSSPLFLFHSFHLLHTPLNVPNSYLKKVRPSGDSASTALLCNSLRSSLAHTGLTSQTPPPFWLAARHRSTR